MSSLSSIRLRIPSNYYIYADPPDKEGEEALHFVSTQRRVSFRGRAFREFVQTVVPLLDGTRSPAEIAGEVGTLFETGDLEACLQLLREQGLLEDSSRWDLPEAKRQRLQPQLNLFQMLSPEPWELQKRLSAACVGVFGLSGIGAGAAQALAAAGIGELRCIDAHQIQPADLYSVAPFDTAAIGRPRAAGICDWLSRAAPETVLKAVDSPLADDEAIARAVEGCTFVINCLDEGEISTAYKLNRACLRLKLPWTSAAADGVEVVVGPTVFPGETGCYMCYRMRAVASSANPEAAFDFQSHLDRRKHDDSGSRANLVAGTAIAGQLGALEALKLLSGALNTTLRGRVLVFDLRELTNQLHVLLRKPWCPACFASWDEANA